MLHEALALERQGEESGIVEEGIEDGEGCQ